MWSNLLPNLQRGGGGPCRNFAYYSMQLYDPGDPKGGPWPNGPPVNTPLAFIHTAVTRCDGTKIIFSRGLRTKFYNHPCLCISGSNLHIKRLKQGFQAMQSKRGIDKNCSPKILPFQEQKLKTTITVSKDDITVRSEFAYLEPYCTSRGVFRGGALGHGPPFGSPGSYNCIE